MTGEVEPSDAVRVAFGDNADQARRYAELLATVGVERGLIGPRETDRIWGRHLFNSAAVATLISTAASVIDLGSGAGLPGIPIALARPDLHVVLLEPMARRVRFLDECVQELGLANVAVRHSRAQDSPGSGADVVVARAVAPLPTLAALARPLTKPRGVLLALKGAKAQAEAAALESGGGATARIHQLVDAAGQPATVAEVRWVDAKVRRPARHGRKTS
ncbi:MAG TPA: 16S rRNA (guanine(527)-N(7))-methyltransferase RsmG [Mycobacteriales bacterium]|nr:16S rRNA (guanine(527)-N(7))-methyltransferase RsmG [Mycobacteriales bacterium]